MCGRTAVSLGADGIRRACTYRDKQGRRRHPEWKNADKYSPSYNKCPQSINPVLLSQQHFEKDSSSSEYVLVAMRWGLIPAWFKEDEPSKMQYNTSNCRSDTMMEKLSYKFNKSDIEDKDPGGQRLLTMAGIFDCWEPPNGEEALYSYTIITVEASKSVSSIHHRMPAILDGDEAVGKWLDFAEIPTQEALKFIHPIENLAFHPVSTVVNNSRNNTPECVVPIQLDLKKKTKVSASSKMMMNWLTNKPKKEEDDGLPRWSSQFIQAASASRKTSINVMNQGIEKEEGEPSAKQCKNQ
ncbi:PREDICTED: embryonic stem cell-specific 5-hydroxymethylcytosine-binding protein [Gekko japonicus]|uniref:Abasic site processing protein HMCES n=1 Tax=Gekko japonicus TaxID=146911 RepID=A0ABM1K944_GEKJA|nr:PREDICTED: embryonic stem cell-specific 5-hydroxymethylcytosine-binding protein [Gekko japonicus]